MTPWSTSPYSCFMDQILSECTGWDYLIWKHIRKTPLSHVFWTRSLSLSQRMTLCSTSPVLSYLHSSLGTAWLSKDALLLEQSLALSKGQTHKSGPRPWKRAEWPWTRAPPKAKCSSHYSDLGFVLQPLLRDVNLQLVLPHVKTEAEQKCQSRAPVGCVEKREMKLVCAF